LREASVRSQPPSQTHTHTERERDKGREVKAKLKCAPVPSLSTASRSSACRWACLRVQFLSLLTRRSFWYLPLSPGEHDHNTPRTHTRTHTGTNTPHTRTRLKANERGRSGAWPVWWQDGGEGGVGWARWGGGAGGTGASDAGEVAREHQAGGGERPCLEPRVVMLEKIKNNKIDNHKLNGRRPPYPSSGAPRELWCSPSGRKCSQRKA
jgi:hypothetical protein